jgi:hypothetical protein
MLSPEFPSYPQLFHNGIHNTALPTLCLQPAHITMKLTISN